MSGMTDRDTFAAAALTGLLAGRKFTALDDAIVAEAYAEAAYGIADAMLRERANHIPDAGKMVETPTNLDAAPAARAPEPEPEAARRRPAGGTGDTTHDAAPAVKASVESVAPQPTTRGESDRTDKAAPRPSEGTGDTPDTPKPIKGGVSDRLKPIASEQEPVAWGVANGSRVLATAISHMDAVDMQSEHECDTAVVPLYRHPPCQDFSQKNLTLTDAEREALEFAAAHGETVDADALRGLLERLGGGR